jgi:F-type H+-transporting ATPase subunit b
MLIDWFTVIAQILNFLILVWLLKHFLYKPILNAIDAREKKVADEIASADAKEAEAQKEKEEFKSKNNEFEQQRNDLLNRAKEEAKAERQRLFEEIRKEASDLRAKHQEALRNEKQHLNPEIGSRIQQEVFNIARKVLNDLAGTSLEERAVDVFVQRFRDLKSEEKKQLISALNASPNQVIIRTAFDLTQDQHDLIKKTIKETLGIETQPRFETAPNIISGIELTTEGQKVAWSIADYLTSLEKSVDEILKEQSRNEEKSEPQTKNNKFKSENEPKTEKETDAKQDSEAEQKSETKSESVAKQEINPKSRPT